MKEQQITDCQPDSGNPTVRDERGACGNVSYGWGYTGTYRGNADTAKPWPKVARAVFLPDKPGGKQRRQTSPYRLGSARSTQNPRLPLRAAEKRDSADVSPRRADAEYRRALLSFLD